MTPAELESGLRFMAGIRKPWKAPRLKTEGQPFAPSRASSDRAVGEWVTWDDWTTEHGGADSKRVAVKRRGQVWAGCPKAPGAVWVAPEDGGPAVALSKTLDVLR